MTMTTKTRGLRLVPLLWLIAVAMSAFLSAPVPAQERVDLTAPITKPSTLNCALDYLTLDPDLVTPVNGRIMAVLHCDNGDTIQKVYDATTTPTGQTLLSTLNTSNNSTGTSLIKRVYNRLITDGVITGTVSGTPQ